MSKQKDNMNASDDKKLNEDFKDESLNNESVDNSIKVEINSGQPEKEFTEEVETELDKIKKELEVVNQKVEEIEKENKELQDKLLRRAAEFENYKKRTENDQLTFLQYAGEGIILDFLPVYNDLSRSLDHINDENNLESLKQGLKLVYDKFSKTLETLGVIKIDAKGKSFDFNYHEALMQKEAEDVPAHTVLEEIEPGYIYKDKVLRHAKVIVSQQPSENEKKKEKVEEQKSESKKDSNKEDGN